MLYLAINNFNALEFLDFFIVTGFSNIRSLSVNIPPARLSLRVFLSSMSLYPPPHTLSLFLYLDLSFYFARYSFHISRAFFFSSSNFSSSKLYFTPTPISISSIYPIPSRLIVLCLLFGENEELISAEKGRRNYIVNSGFKSERALHTHKQKGIHGADRLTGVMSRKKGKDKFIGYQKKNGKK